MNYYLIQYSTNHDSGDNMIADDHSTTVVAAPNPLAAHHTLAKELVDGMENRELVRPVCTWEPSSIIKDICFDDSVLYKSKITEIPYADFETMAKYFGSKVYLYEAMATYGNYAEVFPKALINNPAAMIK